jgi:WD40 repeat protein
MGGHSKTATTCDTRPTGRPFRAATGGDDNTVVFYNGTPYKFSHTMKDHTRFVNKVAFSVDGAMLATAGADGKIFLYDGKTGLKIKEITAAEGHKGGIWAMSWDAASKRLFTSSADKTCKIWDVETSSVTTTFAFDKDADEQQVGNVWTPSHMVSLGLSGNLYCLDERAPAQPARTVYGHSKAITAFTMNHEHQTFFTGSYDGVVRGWDYASGLAFPKYGNGHSNQVTALCTDATHVFTAAMDNTCRVASIDHRALLSAKQSGLELTPVAMALVEHGTKRVVLNAKGIVILDDEGNVKHQLNTKYAPQCVAVAPTGNGVVVGGDACASRLS